MLQVKEGTTSSFGKPSQIVLTASQLRLLWMRKYFAAMEVGFCFMNLRIVHTVHISSRFILFVYTSNCLFLSETTAVKHDEIWTM